MSHTVTKRLIIVATILFLVSNCLAQSASYKLRYTSSLRWLSFKEQTATKDKGMIVVGIAGQIDDSSDLMITKFDEYGSTVWSKVFPSSGRLQNMTVIEMSDGNIAVISDLAFATAVGYNSYVFVMKLNCRGEPLWTKRYALPVAVGYKLVQPAGLKEGKNGDLIVSFHSTQRGDLMSAIMRINNTGSMVWSKTFTGTNAECYYIPEAFYKNNKIYVLGQEHYVGNFITPVKRLFSMVLNYDNGAIEKQQGYILAEIIAGQTVLYSHPKIHFDAEQLLDNTFALFGIFSDGTQQTFYYYKLIINEDLSIKQSQAYSTSTRIALQRSKITVFPNGQTHITGPNYESFTHYWYGADKSNNTIFQRKTNYAGSILFNGDQAFPLEGDRYGYLLSHITSNRYEVDIAMVRDNTSNMTPCLGVDTSFVTQVPWQSSLTNWSWATVEDNKVAITDYSLAGVNLNMFSSELCATPKPKLLSITGDATICTGTSTPFLYLARTLKK